ncbi:MAG: tetratricopeptide repeat protein [Ignavibacteria bacterium]|nr:tetratricopeptide repeat protein [Ignavibacteria bacterium]
MPSFCTLCGTALAEGFKFCPNCGAATENAVVKTVEREMLKCTNCGEDNQLAAVTCAGCGASLQDAAIVKEVVTESVPVKLPPTVVAPKAAPVSKKIEKKPAEKKTAEKKTVRPEKTRLILFIAALAVVAIVVILYTNGVFDHSPALEHQQDNVASMPEGKNKVSLAAMQDIAMLEEKMKTSPDDMESLLSLAHLCNDAGLYDKAIGYYKTYLGRNPKEAEVIIDMGVCFFSLKQYDKADSVMKAAIKLSPNHPIGLYNLGIVNLSRGKMEDAKKWFSLLVEKHPESEQAKQAKELLKSHSMN